MVSAKAKALEGEFSSLEFTGRIRQSILPINFEVLF